jgi:hypothetical protein
VLLLLFFVKQQCFEAIASFLIKLEKYFLAQELLIAIRIIFLCYWLASEVEITFVRHLAIIQPHFGHPKKSKTCDGFVEALLNLILLD